MTIESEAALLGAVISKGALYDKAAARVTADSFSDGDHRLIFDAITALAKSGKPIDIVTVLDEARAKGKHLASRIGQLMGQAFSPSNVDFYAQAVAEGSVVRDAQAKVQAFLADGSQDPAKVVELVKELQALNPIGLDRWEANIADTMVETVEELDKIARNKGRLPGIDTGITKLNHILGGWRNSDLIVVGGRPGMGKTAFLCSTISAAANVSPVGLFTLEQARSQIMTRLIAKFAKVPVEKLRTGTVSDPEWPKVTQGLMHVKKLNVQFYDKPNTSIGEIEAIASRMVREQGVKMLAVDYLQKVTNRSRELSRTEQIADTAIRLKNIARRLDVPLIALSQLNRESESRTDKRPRSSDLKGSGDIEQEADQIILLARGEANTRVPGSPSAAELIIDKNRHGRDGIVPAVYFGAFTSFENAA